MHETTAARLGPLGKEPVCANMESHVRIQMKDDQWCFTAPQKVTDVSDPSSDVTPLSERLAAAVGICG